MLDYQGAIPKMSVSSVVGFPIINIKHTKNELRLREVRYERRQDRKKK